LNKLPEIQPGEIRPRQKEYLAAWLAEWHTEQALRTIDKTLPPEATGQTESTADREHDSSVALSRPFADEPEISAGQIRLLASAAVPTAERPVYIATLAMPDRGMILVAPFSTFANPATPGELLTGRATPLLRVICPWNAARVPVFLAQQSWFVDRLSDSEQADLAAALRYLATSCPMGSDLADRIGPPIAHVADPRRAYEQEEQHLLDLLRDAGERLWDAAPVPWAEDAADHRELALAAAETAAAPDLVTRYRVGTTGPWLRLRLHSDWATCGVMVTDPDGALSTLLDGCVVVGCTGDGSSPIEDGQTSCKIAAVEDGFIVVTGQGNVLDLDAQPE